MIDNNKLNSEYTPDALILIHKNKNASLVPANLTYYLEYSDLYPNGKIKGYKPFRMEDLQKLYNFLKSVQEGEITKPSGFIPKNLIACNPTANEYIWFVKGKRRAVSFTKDAGLKDGYIQYPDMVFKVYDKNMWVYFCSKKGSWKTGLYLLPFMNTYDTGNVCLGNINLKKATTATSFDTLLKAWEDIYFNSKFSHGAGGSAEFMKAIINKKKFPWHLSQKYKFKKIKLHVS